MLKLFIKNVLIFTLLLNSLKIQQAYSSPIPLKKLLPQDIAKFCAYNQCKVILPNDTVTILPVDEFYAFIVANSSRNGYLHDEQSNRIEEIHDNDITQYVSPTYENEDEKIDTPVLENVATTMTYEYETLTDETIESETMQPDSTPFLHPISDIPALVNNLEDSLVKIHEEVYNEEELCNSTTILSILEDYAIEMTNISENHHMAHNSPENEAIRSDLKPSIKIVDQENEDICQESSKCNVLYPNGTIVKQCPSDVISHTVKQSTPKGTSDDCATSEGENPRLSIPIPEIQYSTTISQDNFSTDGCEPSIVTDESGKPITDKAGDPVFINKHGYPITDSDGFAVSTDANGHPVYTDTGCNPITDRRGDPVFTDPCQNPITDRFGYAVYTDKDGNPITDSSGRAIATDHNHRPIFTDKCGNMITDKNGNAIYTDKGGRWMTDSNGMAIYLDDETPVYTYSDGKPITDEKGHYVYTDSHGNPILKGTMPMKPDMITDKNGNVIYTDKAGNMITDKNGNAIYTDKEGKWMTDSNGLAVYNDTDAKIPVYTYSDGKPITDDRGHYVYTDNEGNPILKGTTPMKSNEDYVYEDLSSTEFYDYDSYVKKIPQKKMEEAKKMTKCISKKINHNILCVCNSTYCDKFLPIRKLSQGKYLWVTSTRSGLRFEEHIGEFAESKGANDVFFVNSERKFQNIFGFGGTFTDAASTSIQRLRTNMKNNLLESYFGFFGIHYTMGRVPIGGTDFSPRPYTYLDHTSGTVEEFMLTEYDLKYKIPVIQNANSFVPETPLKLIASAWLAPKWMNENCNYSYADALKRDYWPLWAHYHIKFFEQYAHQNIEFWAFTTGSEPMFKYHNTTTPSAPRVSWSPYEQQQWVAYHLAPQLHNSSYDHLLILAFDDNRQNLPFYLKWFFENFEGKKYQNLQYFKVNEAYKEISGIALHWYTDTKENLKYLDWSNELYPDKFLFYTEACCVGITELGSWDCAERYAINLITNLNHWVTGWLDWNLASDHEDRSDFQTDTSSPIIIDANQEEFYKQPNYYVMGHFSKFILPDSIRIEVTPSTLNGVSAVAVRRPDAGYVIIFYNENEHYQEVIFVINKVQSLSVAVAGKSINSVIFW